MKNLLQLITIILLLIIFSILLLGCGKDTLHDAVVNRDIEKVRKLLKKGANINKRDKKGYTPLYQSIYNPDMTEFLIKNGANVTDVRRGWDTPLHSFARAYSDDLNSYLMEDLDYTDEIKRVVPLLIKKGAKIHARDEFGRTPLSYAAHVEVARILVKHGARVNEKDNEGNTPLHHVAKYWNYDRFQVYRIVREYDREKNYDESYKVLGRLKKEKQEAKLARFLLRKGAKVNARNKLGRTPLHHVFEVDVARVLLKHGANMHARDNNRYMPIHAVASVREWGDDYNRRDLIKLNYHNYAGKMAKFLIKNGAKINAKAINKRTPLDFAWDAGHSTVTLENRLTGSTRHYNSQKTRVYMILEKSGAKHSREYSEFEKPGDPSPDDFPPEY